MAQMTALFSTTYAAMAKVSGVDGIAPSIFARVTTPQKTLKMGFGMLVEATQKARVQFSGQLLRRRDRPRRSRIPQRGGRAGRRSYAYIRALRRHYIRDPAVCERTQIHS